MQKSISRPMGGKFSVYCHLLTFYFYYIGAHGSTK